MSIPNNYNTPETANEKFMKKADRRICWEARDDFQKCFMENGENLEACKALRTIFEEKCPNSWVKHFDRKFDYEKFKSELYQSGYKKVDQKEFNKSSSS